MLCEKCGQEYDGNECPNCAFEKQSQQGTLNNRTDSGVSPMSAQEQMDNNSTPVTSGVHSDTIYQPIGGHTPTPGGYLPSSEPKQNHCRFCGAVLREGAQFCGQCGEKVVLNIQSEVSSDGWHQNGPSGERRAQVCPSCGAVIVDGGQFCAQCGTPVNPVGVPPMQNPVMGSGNSFTDNYLYALRNDTTGEYHKKAKPWIVVVVIIGFLLLQILPLVIGLISFDQMIEESSYRNYYYYQYDGNASPEEDSDYGYSDTRTSVLPNGVSAEEYEQLELGMSYGEISYLIGGDAMQQSQMEDGSVMAVWPGEYDVTATVSILFEDGVAVEISEDGLLS